MQKFEKEKNEKRNCERNGKLNCDLSHEEMCKKKCIANC